MSWEQDCINLYDKNADKVGKIEYKQYKNKDKIEYEAYTLLPVFHNTAAAHITVELNEKGEFLRAAAVDKEDRMTIIPITDKSDSRTAGKEPHPLCDNIKYLAGDYSQYSDEKKVREYYEAYIEKLRQWHFSEYTHPKVDAIYTYLNKEELVKDLIRERILILDENGMLDEKVTIQGVSQVKAMVRFIVRQNDVTQILEEACWKDKTLQKAYIEYYRSLQKTMSMDYLTGTMQGVSYLHSKKIRNEGDGTKLISSNDEKGYTYLGRFLKKEDAFSIGYETSQKMHNALKWIIRKQGYSFDTLKLVTWQSDMVEIPFWGFDTATIAEEVKEKNDFSDEFAEKLADDFEEDDIEDMEEAVDDNVITVQQFYQALNGYRKKVDNTSQMILLAVDAASPGRLAVVEYQSLNTLQYLDNIEKWHNQGSWRHVKYKEGRLIYYDGVPGVKDITDILYGIDDEKKKILTIPDKNGKKLYAQVTKRLIPCIWRNTKLPVDLVQLAVYKASRPLAYKQSYNWKRVLTLACSFEKKYRHDNYKEEWVMALDKKCKKRDYLYGRLLAVAERVEWCTYIKDKDLKRVTNAKRYMTTFSQRPYTTWKILEENLQPYLNKLEFKTRTYYENVLNEILWLFEKADYHNDTPLEGLYLLGYHCQLFEFQQNKEKKEDIKEEQDNE